MANFLENLGLEFMVEDEETFMKTIAYIQQNYKFLHVGYSGNLYIYKDFGDAEIVLNTIINQEEKALEFNGWDTHEKSNTLWKVSVLHEIENCDESKKKVVVARREDRSGGAVLNLIFGDVIPSYLEDDLLNVQVIAFPTTIDYYENEEECDKQSPVDSKGRTFGVATGSIFPIGLFDTEDDSEDKEDFHLIKGVVKNVYQGEIDFEGEKTNPFIRIIIDTNFGELEIVHTIEQVEEEQRKNIKVGAIVYGIFVLSGDVAILDYGNGIVFDEENDLRALRYSLLKRKVNRLDMVIDENCSYYSLSGEAYIGKEAILDRLKYVCNNADIEDILPAIVTGYTEKCQTRDYEIGKKCLYIMYKDDLNASVMFVDINDKGQIETIYVSDADNYDIGLVEVRYKKIEELELSDIDKVNRMERSMVGRAKYNLLIDFNVDTEDILNDDINYNLYYDKAMQTKLSLEMDPDTLNENIEVQFGELFLESYFREKVSMGNSADSYSSEKYNEMIKEGLSFFIDYKFDLDHLHIETKEEQDELIMRALIMVQKLGRYVAHNEVKK